MWSSTVSMSHLYIYHSCLSLSSISIFICLVPQKVSSRSYQYVFGNLSLVYFICFWFEVLTVSLLCFTAIVCFLLRYYLKNILVYSITFQKILLVGSIVFSFLFFRHLIVWTHLLSISQLFKLHLSEHGSHSFSLCFFLSLPNDHNRINITDSVAYYATAVFVELFRSLH